MSDRSNEHSCPDSACDAAADHVASTEVQPPPTKRDKVRMVAVQTGSFAMMVPWG